MLSARHDSRADLRRPQRESKSSQQTIPHPCRARYLILMAMVPPSAPQTNRTLSEMVPWRCLTLALERLLARRRDGILVNPAEPIVSPFPPNGVTIRSQGTKAPVKTLE